MDWRIFRLAETVSTNEDAKKGRPWDVFAAAWQSAGRGRIGHRWLSPPGENVMLSAVLPAGDAAPAEAATLPLAVGLAVAEAVATLSASAPVPPRVSLKWPNDVLCGGRKIAGILCERCGGNVVAGIGLNVLQRVFPPEIEHSATSLALLGAAHGPAAVEDAMRAVLDSLARVHREWSAGGFAAVHPRIRAIDGLAGRTVEVFQTDSDSAPVMGVCGGIRPDGALDVGGVAVWAGEAHVGSVSP